jgi:AcrR family transcriptional regulator
MTRDKEILAAALRLFYERGYGAVGVDAIGAQAGIAGPSIYTHFNSKAEILAALFDESMDRMLALAGPVREDPREELEHLARTHARFALEQRKLLTIYTREDRALADADRRRFRRRQSDYVDRWVDALAQLHAERTRQELRSIASAVIGLMMSVTDWPHDALATENLPDILADAAMAATGLTTDRHTA